MSKKSFILYCDTYENIKDLSLDDKGKLLDSIFNYAMETQINPNNPVNIDGAAKMAFNFIKSQMDRDTNKYNSFVEKQRVNGAKGGRPKKTQITQALFGKPKKAYTVTDTVTDNETVILKKVTPKKEKNLYSKEFEDFWKIYPRKIGKYKSAQSYQKAINGGTSHETIESTAGQFATSCNGEESKFIKHATTWLNGKHWEDDYTTALARPKSGIDAIVEEIKTKRRAEWAAREANGEVGGTIDGNAETVLEHTKEVRTGGKQLH